MGAKLNQDQVDIVYWKNKRKEDPCLVYETFLSTLITIAKQIYSDLYPMDAFIRLHDEYFLTRYGDNNLMNVPSEIIS